MSHKIGPLPGSLQVEFRRCGKPACRCTRGQLHGPYTYRYWRESGRRRKQYVAAAEVREVLARLSAWRRLHPPARTARQALADLRRLERGIPAKET